MNRLYMAWRGSVTGIRLVEVIDNVSLLGQRIDDLSLPVFLHDAEVVLQNAQVPLKSIQSQSCMRLEGDPRSVSISDSSQNLSSHWIADRSEVSLVILSGLFE